MESALVGPEAGGVPGVGPNGDARLGLGHEFAEDNVRQFVVRIAAEGGLDLARLQPSTIDGVVNQIIQDATARQARGEMPRLEDYRRLIQLLVEQAAGSLGGPGGAAAGGGAGGGGGGGGGGGPSSKRPVKARRLREALEAQLKKVEAARQALNQKAQEFNNKLKDVQDAQRKLKEDADKALQHYRRVQGTKEGPAAYKALLEAKAKLNEGPTELLDDLERLEQEYQELSDQYHEERGEAFEIEDEISRLEGRPVGRVGDRPWIDPRLQQATTGKAGDAGAPAQPEPPKPGAAKPPEGVAAGAGADASRGEGKAPTTGAGAEAPPASAKVPCPPCGPSVKDAQTVADCCALIVACLAKIQAAAAGAGGDGGGGTRGPDYGGGNGKSKPPKTEPPKSKPPKTTPPKTKPPTGGGGGGGGQCPPSMYRKVKDKIAQGSPRFAKAVDQGYPSPSTFTEEEIRQIAEEVCRRLELGEGRDNPDQLVEDVILEHMYRKGASGSTGRMEPLVSPRPWIAPEMRDASGAITGETAAAAGRVRGSHGATSTIGPRSGAQGSRGSIIGMPEADESTSEGRRGGSIVGVPEAQRRQPERAVSEEARGETDGTPCAARLLELMKSIRTQLASSLGVNPELIRDATLQAAADQLAEDLREKGVSCEEGLRGLAKPITTGMRESFATSIASFARELAKLAKEDGISLSDRVLQRLARQLLSGDSLDPGAISAEARRLMRRVADEADSGDATTGEGALILRDVKRMAATLNIDLPEKYARQLTRMVMGSLGHDTLAKQDRMIGRTLMEWIIYGVPEEIDSRRYATDERYRKRVLAEDQRKRSRLSFASTELPEYVKRGSKLARGMTDAASRERIDYIRAWFRNTDWPEWLKTRMTDAVIRRERELGRPMTRDQLSRFFGEIRPRRDGDSWEADVLLRERIKDIASVFVPRSVVDSLLTDADYRHIARLVTKDDIETVEEQDRTIASILANWIALGQKSTPRESTRGSTQHRPSPKLTWERFQNAWADRLYAATRATQQTYGAGFDTSLFIAVLGELTGATSFSEGVQGVSVEGKLLTFDERVANIALGTLDLMGTAGSIARMGRIIALARKTMREAAETGTRVGVLEALQSSAAKIRGTGESALTRMRSEAAGRFKGGPGTAPGRVVRGAPLGTPTRVLLDKYGRVSKKTVREITDEARKLGWKGKVTVVRGRAGDDAFAILGGYGDELLISRYAYKEGVEVGGRTLSGRAALAHEIGHALADIPPYQKLDPTSALYYLREAQASARAAKLLQLRRGADTTSIGQLLEDAREMLGEYHRRGGKPLKLDDLVPSSLDSVAGVERKLTEHARKTREIKRGFERLASRRAHLRQQHPDAELRRAGSKGDEHTVAMLEIGGERVYGRNVKLQDVTGGRRADSELLGSLDLRTTAKHAEGEAAAIAVERGLANQGHKRAEIWVDRPLCPDCKRKGIRDIAEALGVDEVVVYELSHLGDPGWMRVFTR